MPRRPRFDDPEPAYVRAWLLRKTVVADGRPDSLPVAAPASVRLAVARFRERRGVLAIGRRQDGWVLLEAGLLRDGCRLSYP